MASKFGQQMGSLKALKKTLAKGSGNAWIKYIPKNGSMNTRFIEEPEQWINYVEHYDQTLRKSYPCNGETSCPGCQTGERKSNRYLANAVDTDQDRVIPLQLPKDLANRLVVRYEKNGTLTDRDFELSRSGDGLDTVYDLDAGMKDRKKIDKYKPLDLLNVLEDAYNEVFGPDTEDEPEEAPKATLRKRTTPGARSKARSAAAAELDEADDEADDEEEPVKPAAKKAAAKKAAAKKKAAPPEPVFEADDEDDADEGEEGPDAEDEDDGYDEESLRALPLGALRAVAREFGVNPRGMGQDDIVTAILDAGDPVDDDEEEIPF